MPLTLITPCRHRDAMIWLIRYASDAFSPLFFLRPLLCLCAAYYYALFMRAAKDGVRGTGCATLLSPTRAARLREYARAAHDAR